MISLFKFIKTLAPWLFAIWLVLILIFSSISKLPDTKILSLNLKFEIDYLLHFLEYAGLGFLALLSFHKSAHKIMDKRVLNITLFLILFAALDESHQLLIPARSFNLLDLAANIAGLLCGLVVAILLNRKAV